FFHSLTTSFYCSLFIFFSFFALHLFIFPLLLFFFFFFFQLFDATRDLHSFPTRRSSDLDAEPGDTLEIEMIDFRQLDWGWTALIPGFGLLSDTFTDPEIKIFDLKNRNRAEFLHGIDIFIKPFPGTMGVALAEPGVH